MAKIAILALICELYIGGATLAKLLLRSAKRNNSMPSKKLSISSWVPKSSSSKCKRRSPVHQFAVGSLSRGIIGRGLGVVQAAKLI